MIFGWNRHAHFSALHAEMTQLRHLCAELRRERDKAREELKKVAPTLYCSFCGKSQHEVEKLIAGPKTFICNECVDLCNDIIREGRGQEADQ